MLEGARAVSDSEGGGLSDDNGRVVDNDRGGSRAVGGEGGDDLSRGGDNVGGDGGNVREVTSGSGSASKGKSTSSVLHFWRYEFVNE